MFLRFSSTRAIGFFFNFQVQANNDFSFGKDKEEALLLGVFGIFYRSIV
jgi:hypothetical protein